MTILSVGRFLPALEICKDFPKCLKKINNFVDFYSLSFVKSGIRSNFLTGPIPSTLGLLNGTLQFLYVVNKLIKSFSYDRMHFTESSIPIA